MGSGGGEEAQALNLALVSLVLSNGQSLGIGVQGTTGEGPPFSRNSAMPTALVHTNPPPCLASDMCSLCTTEFFAGNAGLWHLMPGPQGPWAEYH